MAPITRREVLLTSTSAASSLVAGCQGDYASGRELYIQDIEGSQTDSQWNFTVIVTSNDNTEQGGFSDVRIVGYSEGGQILCEERIGGMKDGSMTVRRTVKLECDSFPLVIAPEAESNACAEGTYIDIRVYDNRTDTWDSHQMSCGETVPELASNKSGY